MTRTERRRRWADGASFWREIMTREERRSSTRADIRWGQWGEKSPTAYERAYPARARGASFLSWGLCWLYRELGWSLLRGKALRAARAAGVHRRKHPVTLGLSAQRLAADLIAAPHGPTVTGVMPAAA